MSGWDEVTAIATAVAAGGGLIAVAFGARQLVDIAEQRKLEREAVQQSVRIATSQAYGEISRQATELRRGLLSEGVYHFFYEDEPPDDARKDLVELMCEWIVDFVDCVVEQRKTIPPEGMDWSTWDVYFRFLYAHSPALRRYVLENLDFYPDYVFEAMGLLVVRDASTGAHQSSWRVRELCIDEPDDEAEDGPTGDLARDREAGPDEPVDDERPRHDASTVTPESDRALLDSVFLGEDRPSGVAGFPWIRTWLMHEVEHEGRQRGEAHEDGPTFIAAVEPRSARDVVVRVGWARGSDTAAERRLIDWVLTTLAASSRIERVEVVGSSTSPGGSPRIFHIAGRDDDGEISRRRSRRAPQVRARPTRARATSGVRDEDRLETYLGRHWREEATSS